MYYSFGVASAKEAQITTKNVLKQMAEAINLEQAKNIFSSSPIGAKYLDTPIEHVVWAEEKELCEFIKTYSPNKLVRDYFLTPIDFDNLNVLCKYDFLQNNSKPFLVEGNEKIANLIEAIKTNNSQILDNKALAKTFENYLQLKPNKSTTLAQIDLIIKKSKYTYLKEICHKGEIKDYVLCLLDLQNLSVIMRCQDEAKVKEQFVAFGHIDKESLMQIFEKNQEVLQKNFCQNQLLKDIIQVVLSKGTAKAILEFDKQLNNFMLHLTCQKKFDLGSLAPFLYYVFKKQNELKNLNLIFSCKKNGINTGVVQRLLEV